MKPNEWGLLVILAVFWGASFFFVEVALRDFQPFTLVFLRIGLAALVLVGVVYIIGVGILGEVIKVVEYAGMGCIFLGLMIIDGRALGLLQRLTGRRAIESREETVSKAAS